VTLTRQSRTWFVDLSLLDERDPDTGWRVCRYCKKPIDPSTRKRFYCSRECREKTYDLFTWSRIRREVWKRDGRRCQYPTCGKRINLKDAEIHHITPYKKFRYLASLATTRDRYPSESQGEHGRYYGKYFKKVLMLLWSDRDNLITYCHECHNIKHKQNRNKRKGARQSLLKPRSRHHYLTKKVDRNFAEFWKMTDHLTAQSSLYEFMAQEATH